MYGSKEALKTLKSLYLYKAEIRLRVKKGSSPRHSRQVRLPGDPSKFSVRYMKLSYLENMTLYVKRGCGGSELIRTCRSPSCLMVGKLVFGITSSWEQ